MNDESIKPATIKVTLMHARELGYCAKGMRRWFDGRERTWAEFVEQGVDIQWLEATNDAMAIRLAKFAQRLAQADQTVDDASPETFTPPVPKS